MKLNRATAWSVSLGLLAIAGFAFYSPKAAAVTSRTGWTIIGWNDLGMHCMDRDFSVFSLLPPFNTIRAQIVNASGKLVKDPAGLTVTYEPVADVTGAINTTSVGKTNFWTYAQSLFGLGAPLPANMGLKGYPMPGAANVRKPMTFDASFNGFTAVGIPITPVADGGAPNTYPMMKLSVRNSSGTLLASTNIVLPVSSEMSCKLCHASDSGVLAARPPSGWVYYPGTTEDQKDKDVRLNILKLHDDKRKVSGVFSAAYLAALQRFQYSTSGLYATASAATGAKPILCATCHSSAALEAAGLSGIPSLTSSVHTLHGSVTDPVTGTRMNDATNRDACYRCHPGSSTKCLRGAMGSAVGPDGSMSMQCQNCHGNMNAVGEPTRAGWLDQPSCQNCHTGTAVSNSGAIRFTSVFDATGARRTAANPTFATNANAPAAGLNLYRFSAGHGGLQCEACHGSTHAEYPASHPNDNVQSTLLQGHKGTLGDCNACHVTVPSTVVGGPHGMHPVDTNWVMGHHDSIKQVGKAACAVCHGSDYRGTELSRTNGDRTFTNTKWGTLKYYRGFQIGCYTCHAGPSSSSTTSNKAPVVSSANAATSVSTPLSIPLTATDANGNTLTLRVISQPLHGTAGISGKTATFYPDPGYAGTDSFTFSAWDGYTSSNLGTVSLSIR